ncbi:MAG: hypothetical protein DHS20C16_03540 [Phycisphaerae bacterium]|nr:MAG: hypothetical protein DHS20C16_03540 [Phycisphaerae bacterium]
MIESDLQSLLLTDATLIANSVTVQPHRGRDLDPDDNYVLYTVVSNSRVDNKLTQAAATEEKRIQYDVWSKSYVTARTIANAITTLLHRHQGTVGSHTVYGIFHDSERETTANLTSGQDVVMYGVQVDFRVTYL